MMNEIYKTIRCLGGRLTETRKAVVDILITKGCLLSRLDVINALEEKNIRPNRSTIYRELRFLTDNNIVIKNNIGGCDYYEIQQEQHYHLVCLKCNNIEIIHMNNDLKKEEVRIFKKNKFSVQGHSLEFYGYCQKCQE